MTSLLVAGTAVRVDAAGRYNLGDLHRAAGKEARHRPSRWIANQKTQELIWEIETKAGKPALVSRQGGKSAGSFACRELVYAYAMWISAAFQLSVIQAYDTLVAGKQSVDIRETLRDPNTLRALLVDQVDERLKLEAQAAAQAPAAAALKRLEGAKGSYSLRESAKVLNIGEQSLIEWLLTNRWVYRERERNRVQAFASAVKAGLLLHIPVIIDHPNGDTTITTQTKVSGKGIARLAKALTSSNHLSHSSNPLLSFHH